MKPITQCKSCHSDELRIIFSNIRCYDFIYDIVECRQCKLRFRNIELENTESQNLYGDDYFQEHLKNYFFDNESIKRDIFKNRMSLVNSVCRHKGNLLDIGSAVGTFIAVAKNEGWQETGVEISGFASDIAKQKGLNSIQGGIQAVENLKQVYDAVTLWDAIDHFENQIRLLGAVHGLIRPGGYLFVGTEFIDSLMYKIAESAFRISFGLLKDPVYKGYPVEHSNYYSTQSIRNDIERVGFEIDNVVREKYNKNLLSFPSRLHRMFAGLIESISAMMNKQLIGIVIARKP